MIELIVAVVIGFAFGYLLKKEQQPPIVEVLQNQVEKLEEDVTYYKKLTKGLVEENADMRTRLRKHGEKYE